MLSLKKIFGSMSRKAAKIAAVAAFLLLGVATSARSDILLTVDVTNPNAVTFTATGAFSSANDSSCSVQTGVVLLDFFTTEPSFTGGTGSGTLTPPSDHGQSYNYWMRDTDTGDKQGLNLYGYSGTSTPIEQDLQEFLTTDAAFTGASTMSLAVYATYLPSVGATGDIWVGSSSFGSHVVIGQWLVVGSESAAVPEPMTLSLLAVGGLAILRRRGKK